jgi:hypothetical protein
LLQLPELVRIARITGPYYREAQGWTGVMPNPPSVWRGAQLHLVNDGELVGPVEQMPHHRVWLGLKNRTRQDIEAAFLYVIAAEQRELEPPFMHVRGKMWASIIPQLASYSDDLQAPSRSSALMVEDGRLSPSPHILHDDIALHGGGRFSHWRGAIYISTLDGSDPNDNGHKFRLLITDPMWPGALRRRVTGPFAFTDLGWTGAVPNPPSIWRGAQLHLIIDGRLGRPIEMLAGNRICVGMEDCTRDDIEAAAIYVVAAELKELEPPFTHARGQMWAKTIPQLSAHSDDLDAPCRSGVMMVEDDQLLPSPHVLHNDIAARGGGRFSHWRHALYFSTFDGSDPNDNGRRYRLLITDTEAQR